MSYYNTDPQYARQEKQDFYNWLKTELKLSIYESRQYMCAIKGVEDFASTRNYHSKHLFSLNRDIVFETVSELLLDDAFRNDYVVRCRIYPVKPTDAIYKLVKYAAAKLPSYKKKLEKRESAPVWDQNNTLYVYKGLLSCQRKGHHLITATAVMLGLKNKDVRMTVTYCKDCNRFFISEVSYEYYRKKYGAIIGNIKLEHSNVTYNGEFLAEESPLHLCGYNVNQQDNYSREERRFIISKIIDRGIMSKLEVINYLEYFISHNGQQSRNWLALAKWKEDLQFTRRYQRESDPVYGITAIRALDNVRKAVYYRNTIILN